jgi:hypothetical protein
MLGMSAPIFISYSSRDQNTALTVCQALENRGLSCWISCRDIGPGENFQVSIVRAIRAAKVMVLVFSANSNNSEEIKKELVLAGQSQLVVIPVRVEDVTPDEAFAYELATRQWIDLFSDWEGAIQRLVRQLAAMEDVAAATGTESPKNTGAGPDTSGSGRSENGTGSFQPRRDKSTPARANFGRLRYFLSAAVIFVLGVAGAVAWYWRGSPLLPPRGGTPFTTQTAPVPATANKPAPAPASLADLLAARFASAVPGLDQKSIQLQARMYAPAPAHKAQAVSLQPPGTWRVIARPDAGNAEEAALEQCQVFFDQPCILMAVDQDVQPLPADGRWQPQDMPRVRYAGDFDPRQIPGLRPENRDRRDILDYRAARGPKAAVYFPDGGRVFMIVDALTQHAAEEQALKACNDEATLNKLNGTCLLYAVADRVVLPLRLQEPLTAPMLQNPPLPAVSAPLREMLSARLASAVPALDEKTRAVIARDYEGESLHKAEAASLEPAGTWRSANRPTSEIAQEFALEDCQIFYGQPCILLATDNTVEPAPGDGKSLRHDMPRVRYAGSYDPRQIPGAALPMRERSDVLGYGSAPSPKAAAFRLVGGQGSRLFVVTKAASQRAAEEQALEACNNDPIQSNRQSPCFLYAVGNQVVLPHWFREPVTRGNKK